MTEMCRRCRTLLPPEKERTTTGDLCAACAPASPRPVEPKPKERARQAPAPVEEPKKRRATRPPMPSDVGRWKLPAPSATPPAPRDTTRPSAPPPVAKFELTRTCDGCGARFPADRNRCPECRLNFKLGKHPEEDEMPRYRVDWRLALLLLLIRNGRYTGTLLIVIAFMNLIEDGWKMQTYFAVLILGGLGLIGWDLWKSHVEHEAEARRVKRRRGRRDDPGDR